MVRHGCRSKAGLWRSNNGENMKSVAADTVDIDNLAGREKRASKRARTLKRKQMRRRKWFSEGVFRERLSR